MVVAGWGYKKYGVASFSEMLLQVSIPVWNQQKCVESFLQRITEHNICAAAYEGGKDSCQVTSSNKTIFCIYDLFGVLNREISPDVSLRSISRQFIQKMLFP